MARSENTDSLNRVKTTNDIIKEFADDLGLELSQILKKLFESKHLYQSVKIEIEDLIKKSGKPQLTGFFEQKNDKVVQLENLASQDWIALDASNRELPYIPREERIEIHFSSPDIKVFCSTCNRVEAFNTIATENFLNRNFQNYRSDRMIQVFIFSYLCQSCKSVPEVFMVRREDYKLILCGRAPIERVDVPKVIPKDVREFFSGALLAYQSGQTLSGNFMLRTLIEQWVRKALDIESMRADEVLEKYMESLPKDFRARFPSLQALYSDLSVDIHNATGSEDLFVKTHKDIIKHFEARQLFDL